MRIGAQKVPHGKTGTDAEIEKHHAEQEKEIEALRAKLDAHYRKVLEEIAKGLAEMQARLRADRQAVVALWRDLARAEHARLEALAAQKPAPARATAEEALKRMFEHREDAGVVAPFADSALTWMQQRKKVQDAVGEAS
jgi:hypothetical protein